MEKPSSQDLTGARKSHWAVPVPGHLERQGQGKARPWSIWRLQCKVFAKAGSQRGSPWPFQRETAAQLTAGHYNKHRKNKRIKQEKEEKNDRGLQRCWGPGLRQLRSLPQVIVRNWKTLSNHLPGAAEQFSSISKQFELRWLYDKGKTVLDLKVSGTEGALWPATDKGARILGTDWSLLIFNWWNIDNGMEWWNYTPQLREYCVSSQTHCGSWQVNGLLVNMYSISSPDTKLMRSNNVTVIRGVWRTFSLAKA